MAQSSISSITASATGLPPSGAPRSNTSIFCPLLPSVDKKSWGRDIIVHRLNVREQIQLVARIHDGVAADKKRREVDRDPEAPRSDNESGQFWEQIYLLVMGCVVPETSEPLFSVPEATQWMTNDEVNGITCADLVQFLLHHIRSANDEAPGLEEVAGGLAIIRKMPTALQALDRAYDLGGDALIRLLNGDVPTGQEETAEMLEKWGGIISAVVIENIKKRAKIQAEANKEQIAELLYQMGVELGYYEYKETAAVKPEDETDEI